MAPLTSGVRGPHTHKGFIGHLYDALVTSGISTFIDNVNLEKGERVNNLSGYIERSRMFVPSSLRVTLIQVVFERD
ncbi:hypothetical protein EJ110_NYTH47110 [Nymphaea thermarum]|nr:hypothetical protein EJ110_NYTH47110 [Nymphaea thermarum]